MKGLSPTQRTLRALREQGLVCARIKGCGKTTVKDAIRQAERENLVRFRHTASGKVYSITEKGRTLTAAHPSPQVWKSESETPV